MPHGNRNISFKDSSTQVLRSQQDTLSGLGSLSLKSPNKRRRASVEEETDAPGPSAPKKGKRNVSSFTRTFRNADPETTSDPKSQRRDLSRCPMCLGRHQHNIFKCSADKLWDGKAPTRCTRNHRGFLNNPSGTELCNDWQKPNGCTLATHPNKHECSGCGEASHGAQECPLGA
jgi:hypothetical protein